MSKLHKSQLFETKVLTMVVNLDYFFMSYKKGLNILAQAFCLVESNQT